MPGMIKNHFLSDALIKSLLSNKDILKIFCMYVQIDMIKLLKCLIAKQIVFTR